MTHDQVRKLVKEGHREFYSSVHDRKIKLIGFHLEDARYGIAYMWSYIDCKYDWIDIVDLSTLKVLDQ